MSGDSFANLIRLTVDGNDKRRFICVGDKNNKTSSTHLFGFVNAVYPEGIRSYPVEFWKVSFSL